MVGFIPSMVAHLHTVLRLHQKAPTYMTWLEYDIHFRMEAAVSEDQTWTTGDPWQYVSCLPGLTKSTEPFDMAEQLARSQGEPKGGPSGMASLSQHLGSPGAGKASAHSTRPTRQGLRCRAYVASLTGRLEAAPWVRLRLYAPLCQLWIA